MKTHRTLVLFSAVLFLSTGICRAADNPNTDPVATKYKKRLTALQHQYLKEMHKAREEAIKEYKVALDKAMNEHNLDLANQIQAKIDQLSKKGGNTDRMVDFFNSITREERARYTDDPDEVVEGDNTPVDQYDTDAIRKSNVPPEVTGEAKSMKGKPADNEVSGEERGFKLEYIGQEEQKRNMKVMEQMGNRMGVEEGNNVDNNYKNWLME